LKKKLMSDEIEKIFYEHPNIGRDGLAKEANISNQKARFYVQLQKSYVKEAQT